LDPLRVAAECVLPPDSRWPGHIPPQEAAAEDLRERRVKGPAGTDPGTQGR
jgi:hypothetical protein